MENEFIFFFVNQRLSMLLISECTLVILIIVYTKTYETSRDSASLIHNSVDISRINRNYNEMHTLVPLIGCNFIINFIGSGLINIR